MIRLKIDDRQVQTELKRLLDRSQNPGPAMAAISRTMEKAVIYNFRAEGRPGKWKPLAPATLAARARKRQSGKILQASGHLYRSIMPFHTSTVAGVGTNVPYAAAQNFGLKERSLPKVKGNKSAGKESKRGKHPVKLPARPFMVIDDGSKEDFLWIMAKHIESGR